MLEIFDYPEVCVQDEEAINGFCEILAEYFREDQAAESCTCIDDMWDSDTRTFKLAFSTKGLSLPYYESLYKLIESISGT